MATLRQINLNTECPECECVMVVRDELLWYHYGAKMPRPFYWCQRRRSWVCWECHEKESGSSVCYGATGAHDG